MKIVKQKPIHISVHPEFYKWIQAERIRFMRKKKLMDVSTPNFTERLAREMSKRRIR